MSAYNLNAATALDAFPPLRQATRIAILRWRARIVSPALDSATSTWWKPAPSVPR